MANIPLEDSYTDIIAKTQRGLSIGDEELSKRSGVAPAELARLKSGELHESNARKVAAGLNLGADALIELAKKAWFPAPLETPGLACFNTPYDDMMVNSYLVFDPKTKEGVAFDTGATCEGMMAYAAEHKIKITLILITHTHIDHIVDLEKLKKETGAPAYVGEKENFPKAEAFAAGKTFKVGNLKIETRQTSGHARGGITYVISGLDRKLAIVGDAIFAASMGGGMISFAEALATNRKEIFSLPDETIICSGHGPLTTVGEQKKHNAFYPEFQK